MGIQELKQMTYERTGLKTTFFEDFTIADVFGKKAVVDTYKRCHKEWKNSIEYYTQFVMALNWKLWEHYEKGNDELSKLYERLWCNADKFVQKHFKSKDLVYYYRITD